MSLPKQFLECNGKPIIIYTLELFDRHPQIDGIVVACLASWIPYLESMLRRFEVSKVLKIVPGGETGQESIYHGLLAAEELSDDETVVLIHDGVRPLIDADVISRNIQCVKDNGNCITCVPATETFMVRQDNGALEVPQRDRSLLARAPQSFFLKDIISAHRRAVAEGKNDFIDSCTMMSHYGYQLSTIIGPVENIKITTPTDFYVFRALVELRENQQIFGL